MPKVYALIDCNNFFASCERVFRPDLEGKPVIVLSSNDGCAVARSNEAKRLGIPMGAPVFKYRQILQDNHVTCFSANFELYGDISDRITRLLTEITPHIEVYSVDESFLDLSELDIPDYAAWGRAIKERIQREIGVPVSIGIAPSKTLAKLAADRAKKDLSLGGALDVTIDGPLRHQQMRAMPVGDVWGVGRKLSPKLKSFGIFTAEDLSTMSLQLAKQVMGIHGRQMVSELRGLSCYPLETIQKVRQSVMHGRQFGADTSDLTVLEAAIASLSARATFRLRRDQLLAHSAIVSLSTNKHKPGYQYVSRYINFVTPTADTGVVTTQLMESLKQLFSKQSAYHRANVLLYNLIPETGIQADLFNDIDLPGSDRSRDRNRALDTINSRFGSRTLHYAAEDLSQAWTPKHELRSPRYTSNWQELPIAKVTPYASPSIAQPLPNHIRPN
jgi:DNA polymerase V